MECVGEKSRYYDLFPDTKAVIGMIHSRGDATESAVERAEKEIEIYQRCGVDAVLVEDYFGTAEDVEKILEMLSGHYSGVNYGVNILRDYRLSFGLARKYKAGFVQIDSVCGHLPPADDQAYADDLQRYREKNPSVVVLGGVHFKYQPVLSGRSLTEDLTLGMKRCDAIVVTGDRTGRMTPLEKIAEFRERLGDFPLIIGAGVAPQFLKEELPLCDGMIVGSYFKKKHMAIHDVSENNVRRLISEKCRLTGKEIQNDEIDEFTGEYRHLSMKSVAAITIDGVTYGNIAAAWLAQAVPQDKKTLFSDATAHQARRLFRLYHACPDWERIQYDVLYKVCEAKYRQDPALARKLLATGTKRIIYDTTATHDNVLGRCGCDACQTTEKQNLYGKILMKIRDALAKDS